MCQHGVGGDMIVERLRLVQNQMYCQSIVKYKHGEIELRTVMIGSLWERYNTTGL